MTATTELALNRNDFFPALFAIESCSLQQLGATSCRFASFLWRNIDKSVAESRADWSLTDWQSRLSQPGVAFYAAYEEMEPAGCFELESAPRLMKSGPAQVSVRAFGLLPEFTGEGLGSWLMTRMAEKGFAMGAGRITLHSDAPLADNFLFLCRQQGFRLQED